MCTRRGTCSAGLPVVHTYVQKCMIVHGDEASLVILEHPFALISAARGKLRKW